MQSCEKVHLSWGRRMSLNFMRNIVSVIDSWLSRSLAVRDELRAHYRHEFNAHGTFR